MRKYVFLLLITVSSFFYSQDRIDTRGYSYTDRYNFYISLYNNILKEDFKLKIKSIDKDITEQKMEDIFNFFEK